jgi:hypothetical protein
MGRKARLKRERRQKRIDDLNEAWGYFTSRSFLSEVRRMILDSGTDPSSCIACTKVLCQLGEDLGVDISPIVVETSVYNPTFAEYIEKNGLDPTAEEMMRLGRAGGRFVVLGSRLDREPEPDKWPGHLVALMKAKGKPTTVIDLSIDQANRPKKDINITDPVVFGVPDGFVDGSYVAVGYAGTSAGKICFVYHAIPEDTSYEESPDWQRDYGARTYDKIDFGGLPEKTPE